jgi:hypothetical protein
VRSFPDAVVRLVADLGLGRDLVDRDLVDRDLVDRDRVDRDRGSVVVLEVPADLGLLADVDAVGLLKVEAPAIRGPEASIGDPIASRPTS